MLLAVLDLRDRGVQRQRRTLSITPAGANKPYTMQVLARATVQSRRGGHVSQCHFEALW